jgi:eukaryotic-like serine/threonine-protein kinase
MPFFCIHCRSAIDPTYKACPFCGDPISDFLRSHFDTPVDGKYQILSRLGIGGMGEVYKALHIHLNALRVIKLMRPVVATDPTANERFLREARLATRIHHPNVATLFDFAAVNDGSWFMVWEYIEGTNLHELIDSRGPLSPKYAAMLAVQALMGLDAIHRAGIVHRDISPENLMITRDDEGNEHVKIIDLGIAKGSGSGEEAKTQTGMFVGKWKYCSPEHLGMMPDGERIDGRADLYSFGIVLYEMLTGIPPFQADTPHAYVMLHASERPKALREVNPNVTASPQLEQIIFKSLEKDRRKRFATAREFAHALEAVLPTLDDRAGAPAPLPTAMEATEEATRVVRPTPAQIDVATVVTTRDDNVGKMTLDRVRPAEEPKRQSRAPVATLIGVVIVIALGIGAWMMRRHDEVAVMKPAVKAAAVVVPPAVAAAHLGINAFPWATVTRVRNIDSGADVPMNDSLMTPAPLELAPGRYEVTLSNPRFSKPITQMVEVAAGEERTIDVHFADPSQAPLPRFGVSE